MFPINDIRKAFDSIVPDKELYFSRFRKHSTEYLLAKDMEETILKLSDHQDKNPDFNVANIFALARANALKDFIDDCCHHHDDKYTKENAKDFIDSKVNAEIRLQAVFGGDVYFRYKLNYHIAMHSIIFIAVPEVKSNVLWNGIEDPRKKYVNYVKFSEKEIATILCYEKIRREKFLSYLLSSDTFKQRMNASALDIVSNSKDFKMGVDFGDFIVNETGFDIHTLFDLQEYFSKNNPTNIQFKADFYEMNKDYYDGFISKVSKRKIDFEVLYSHFGSSNIQKQLWIHNRRFF